MVEPAKQFSICEEIVFHILKYLPVKSLLRFKCVSKVWLGLIEHPFFVDCHTVCAHTRPGGIQILSAHLFPQIDLKFRPCSLSDPDGNLQSESVPLPPIIPFYANSIMSNAEALICFDNCIWNPSTRETMILPLALRTLEQRYLLGFDAFSNKYKVVYCWTCDAQMDINNNDVEHDQVLQVWTLGENHMREIHDIPVELSEDFEILSTKSFSNMIFCLVRHAINESVGVMTFDVKHELVGYVPFPDKFKPQNNDDFDVDLVEIQGRLAFQGIQQTLWVLNHEVSKWTEMNITIPGCCGVKPWHGFVFYGDEYVMARLIPLGTFHTNEILFQCIVEEEKRLGEGTHLKYCFYDPDTNNVRFVSKLEKSFDGIKCGYTMMIKYVDSLVSLKPRD